MAQKNKVAGWYWITSAVLAPFVLLSCVIWAYYAQQVQNYRADGTRMVAKLENDHKQLVPLLNRMKDVAARTGWKMGDPEAGKKDAISKVQRPSVFQGEERTLPPEKQSPLLRAYLDAESRYYGATADDTGYAHEYVAARAWLGSFENKLKRYIALKSYQYYTVQTISIGDKNVQVAGGDLQRSIHTGPDTDSVPVPTEEALNAAENDQKNNKPPVDKAMQEPTKITLELIFRKQIQLLSDLVSADLHQYTLLYADVSGQMTYKYKDENGVEKTATQAVGYEGEQAALKKALDDLTQLNTGVDQRKADSDERLTDALTTAKHEQDSTDGREGQMELLKVASDGRVEILKKAFKNEKLSHETDAQKYRDLIANLPRIKTPIKLEKSDPDGEITYSDYKRGVTNIDLGFADGVRDGQRFEVWRLHGFEKDEFVGVVEIVRMLSAHYSLCTVLSLTKENDPVRKGDKIVSKLWHNGHFLTVALHGTYEPPKVAYTKARLAELLKQRGVRVVDKVQPGTDLVILGSDLLNDKWYRDARDDLRFETIKEQDVRLYVAPR